MRLQAQGKALDFVGWVFWTLGFGTLTIGIGFHQKAVAVQLTGQGTQSA